MTAFAKHWFTIFRQNFVSAEADLGELDRIIGDGDFAVNLSTALGFAAKGVDELPADATSEKIFHAISEGFLHTGGTSGPLLGMWFRDISKSFSNHAHDVVTALAVGVVSGTSTIQRLGGAQRGDKTLVDALIPAGEALEEARQGRVPLEQALRAAANAAAEGAEATAQIQASLGRASYVGDAALGVIDPGAQAIALFFQSGKQAAEAPEGHV